MVSSVKVNLSYNKDSKRCAILNMRGAPSDYASLIRPTHDSTTRSFTSFRMTTLAPLLTVFLLLSAHPAWALAQIPQPPSQRIALAPVLTQGLIQPVFIGHAGDHSHRLFILEQPGRIRILQNGALQPAAFLDISDRVNFGGEMGLLGLAFHPQLCEKRTVLRQLYKKTGWGNDRGGISGFTKSRPRPPQRKNPGGHSTAFCES